MAGWPRSSVIARQGSCRATSWTRSARSRSAPAPSSSESYKPGDRVELVKNPDYFVAGLPKLDAMSSASSRRAPLKVGGPGDGRGRYLVEPAARIDRACPEERQGHGRLGAHVDLGRGHHEQGPQAVRRHACGAPSPWPWTRRTWSRRRCTATGVDAHDRSRRAHPYYNKDIAIPRTGHRRRQEAARRGRASQRVQLPTIFPAAARRASAMGITVKELLKPVGIESRSSACRGTSSSSDVAGKAGVLRRRLLQPADHRYRHLSLVSQQGIVEHGAVELQATRPWTRSSTRRAQRQVGRGGEALQEFQALRWLNEPAACFAYVLNHVYAYRKNVRGVPDDPMMWLDLRRRARWPKALPTWPPSYVAAAARPRFILFVMSVLIFGTRRSCRATSRR